MDASDRDGRDGNDDGDDRNDRGGSDEGDDGLGFETRAVRAGEEPASGPGGSGDIVTPIHLASTFVADRPGDPTHGYKYSRLGNPTRDALEDRLAALDNAEDGLAFASGTGSKCSVAFMRGVTFVRRFA